jgi:glyoxylase-like metal-dependent hydrolase (beta-lactamase superfamily II)
MRAATVSFVSSKSKGRKQMKNTYFSSKPVTATRRGFLAGVASLAVTAALPYRSWATEAPHTFRHGDLEVTVVSDGMVTPPPAMLASDAPPDQLAAAFKAVGFEPGKSQVPANVTLIKGGNDLVLFDTGSGAGLGPSAGKLKENLVAAGIHPDSITKVVFSHGHPDHVWGTIAEPGGLHFPKASYYVAGVEWDFWMDPNTVNLFPPEFQGFATEGQRQLASVKDIVTMLKPGDEIISGVSVLDTAGHTPGHISLELAGGDGLIVVADAIVIPTISFEHPAWKFGMDSIQDLAATNRARLLDRAANEKLKLIGYHWPYPAVGYAEKNGQAYRYVPAS